MIIENIQDTIKQYVEGTLSAKDKTNFEAQLKDSTELMEEVRQFRQLRIFNKNKHLIEANALLNTVMRDIEIEPDYGKYEKYFKKSFWETSLWRWLLGGLTVCMLVVGGLLYQKNQTAKALQELSIAYLYPMENIIGFADTDQTQAAKAMKAYDGKNYGEAIRLLENVVKNTPNDNSLRLYLAISYLMERQNLKAENLLESLVKGNDLSTIPAKWYLALSLMQRGEKEEAKILLQSLESDTTFGNRAKEILKNW